MIRTVIALMLTALFVTGCAQSGRNRAEVGIGPRGAYVGVSTYGGGVYAPPGYGGQSLPCAGQACPQNRPGYEEQAPPTYDAERTYDYLRHQDREALGPAQPGGQFGVTQQVAPPNPGCTGILSQVHRDGMTYTRYVGIGCGANIWR
jgi:hypothetical protein